MSIRSLFFVAKLALTLGPIAYIAWRLDFSSSLARLTDLTPMAVLGAAALFYLQLILVAARFRAFVHLFGSRLGLVSAIDTTFIVYFFSQTFLSFLGGDAMRVLRTSGFGVPVKAATQAVVVDRISGFAAQLLLIALVLPFLLPMVEDLQMQRSLVILIAGSAAFGLTALAAARLLGAWTRFPKIRQGAVASLELLRRLASLRGILTFFGFSLAIASINVVIFYVLARGLSVEIAFIDCVILLPAVFFLSMLPISISGWGVREGAAIVALSLAGVPPESSLLVSIAFGIGLILISLPGGLVWLLATPRERPQAPMG